ncbi:MAG TPA: hypothetical protein VMT16_16245 [Thermoanaerobaculia bacterium]|nr:hypothetical protein [Thermoanaerobaculia bacterium]
MGPLLVARRPVGRLRGRRQAVDRRDIASIPKVSGDGRHLFYSRTSGSGDIWLLSLDAADGARGRAIDPP